MRGPTSSGGGPDLEHVPIVGIGLNYWFGEHNYAPRIAMRSLRAEAWKLCEELNPDLKDGSVIARLVTAPRDFFRFWVIAREHRKRIVDFAAEAHLPAMYEAREFVEAGGLLSYGPSLADTHRRADEYIDKIFKGANPADLPVEQPAKFELLIDMKTAKTPRLRRLPKLIRSSPDCGHAVDQPPQHFMLH